MTARSARILAAAAGITAAAPAGLAAALINAAIVRKPPAGDETADDSDLVAATTAAAQREGRAWMAATPHQRWTVTAHDGTRLAGYYFPAPRPAHRTVILACDEDGCRILNGRAGWLSHGRSKPQVGPVVSRCSGRTTGPPLHTRSAGRGWRDSSRAAWSAPWSEGSPVRTCVISGTLASRAADQHERDGPGSGNLIVITGTDGTDGTLSRSGQALVQDPAPILVTVSGSWRRGVPAKLGPLEGCGWSRAGVCGDMKG